MTLSQALIGEAIPPRERGRYQGYLAGIAVSSNTFGPVAGGYLTQAFGWQSIFLINIPLGLLAVLFVFRIPPRQGDRRRTTFDAPGLVLFILFVGPVILALEQVQRMELSAMPMALALLAFGLVALGLLVWQERLTAAPLIPPRLFRQASIWRADAMAACHGAALVSLITFLPIYLRAVRGASPGETGLILLPLTAGIGHRLDDHRPDGDPDRIYRGVPDLRPAGRDGGPAVPRLLDTASDDHGEWLGRSAPLRCSWARSWGSFRSRCRPCPDRGCSAPARPWCSSPARSARPSAPPRSPRSCSRFSRRPTASTANLFGTIIEQGPEAIAALDPARQAMVHAQIGDAFRAAFLTIATFTGVGTLLAWSLPLRRL